MMFRASSIYISRETKRHLWIVAKARGFENADEAGDKLLAETIAEKYPALVAHQKKIDAMEAEVIESVKGEA